MKQIKGVISALPTPFSNKQVDYVSLTKLVEYQLKNNINGFVVNGTTAESPTLAASEVEKIYKVVRDISGPDFLILIGTGSNCTTSTIANTLAAQELGANAALVVVPYYNKPPQRGLVQHFTAVASAVPQLPIVLYNVPGRTITSMENKTVKILTEIKNIVGIKEASGDLKVAAELKEQLRPSFSILSGDDPTYIDFLNLNTDGIISVMSNVITSQCAQWTDLVLNKKTDDARAAFAKYKTLINLMYVEANPIPIKWMLYKMGLFASAEMRLPLTALEAQHHINLEAEMKKVGLI